MKYPRFRDSTLLLALATGAGCAQSVMPLDGATVLPDGSTTRPDGPATPPDAPPPACVAPDEPVAPIATYASVDLRCGAGSSCPSGDHIHVSGLDVRFPCTCVEGTDPTIEASFDVTDDTVSNDQLTIRAGLMGCVHPGYLVHGTSFSFTCGTTRGPVGQWDVVIADPAGNSAWIGLGGPEACNTVHYTCAAVARPDPYPIECTLR